MGNRVDLRVKRTIAVISYMSQMANDLGNPLGGTGSFNFPINSVAKVRSCKTDILHGIACTAIFS